MKRVLILGGGTGGAVAATRLHRWARPGEVEVTLVDKSPWHEYRPSYLWVMTGKREPEEVRRPLRILEHRCGTKVLQAEVQRIDPANHSVTTSEGDLDYDYLIVSLGSVVQSDSASAGLEAPWELDHALALRERLASFEGGRIAVGPMSWPYRCPPAPFETAFMLRYLSEQRGIAKRTPITVFHPWEQPMEVFGPLMVAGFRRFLERFDVRFEGGFTLDTNDRERKVLVSTKGVSLEYDWAVVVPRHVPPEAIASSPLAAENGYMDVTLPSMRHPTYPEVFGIGDAVAPTIGLGMAGVFAHFQAEHVVSQILDKTRGVYLGELYNTVGICVMDTGYVGAAVWCDFGPKLRGETTVPDCRLIGGMRAMRAVKVAFEKYWFANLFGPDQSVGATAAVGGDREVELP